jgi:hypothetical protein
MAPMFCPNSGNKLIANGQKFFAHCAADLVSNASASAELYTP